MARPHFLELTYQNPRFPQLGIESFRLSELRRRMPAVFFTRIQRPRFHILAVYIDGAGQQEIDFVAFPCTPGTMIHVHPGQVVRYLDVWQAEAHLILFTPEFLWPTTAHAVDTDESLEMTSRLALSGAAFETIRAGFETIAREYDSTDAGPVSEAILRHLLMALLLQIDREARHRSPGEVPPVQHAVFRHFRRELERGFMRTRKVQDYAAILGCSPRTLNRATLSLVGVPVKQFIDDRVVLEAKRLLAHTSLSVGEVAGRLAFSEPTNFVKFFRRETGMLPGEFREGYRAAP